jgi:hypothetical protein
MIKKLPCYQGSALVATSILRDKVQVPISGFGRIARLCAPFFATKALGDECQD